MDKSKHCFLWLVLVALLIPAVLASAATLEREVVAVEYLPEAIVFDPLTAAPGETTQQEVRVPVRYHYADGMSAVGYETATFTLTNEANLLAGTTYVTCIGSLNAGNRQYTGQVDWHFDGSLATLDEGRFPVVHDGFFPYTKGPHNSTANGVQGAPLSVYTAGFFYATSPWSNKDHIITWDLPHNNSHCSATGIIVNAA